MFVGWRPRLVTRMVMAFVLVVISSMTIPALYNFSYLYKRVSIEGDSRMRSNIEIADLLFAGKQRALQRVGRTFAMDMQVEKMVSFRLGNPLRVRVADFFRSLTPADLTSLSIVDRDGVVLLRSQAPLSVGDSLAADPYVRRALRGEEAFGFVEKNPEEMTLDGLTLERRPVSGGVNGLVMKVAVPIFPQSEMGIRPEFKPMAKPEIFEIAGAIIVEYSLNSDKAILSEIRRRTKNDANIYLGENLVNTTRAGLIAVAPPGVYRDAPRWKRFEVRLFPRKREIRGYFPFRDLRGRVIGLFELRGSMEGVGNVWASALWNNILFLMIGIAVSVILGYIMSRRITRPIEALRIGAESIGRGNLMRRIEVPGGDEISELAETFNVMAARLHNTIDQMRLSKKQIEEYSSQLRSAHNSLEMYSRELEKVNQQLLDSNAKLHRANQVKDTFLSTVSHELKTPLTTVLGYLSMFLRGVHGEVTPEQRDVLEVMLRRARNLQSLISDLLSLSRIDAGRLELQRRYVEIERELRSIEEIYSSALREENLSLLIRVDADLPPVYADPGRMVQALTNLVGNAIKFTNPGGRITVEARLVDDSGFVQISVRDTGIGIPESELPHIFERFYQVHRGESREYSGTGLGLAITREIVELHGGKIWVESAPGVGSAFHFTLPTRES